MDVTPDGPALPGITHHYAQVNGTRLHYVAAGTSGSPVLLVHGFPETWWAFRKLIPLLAASHRVFAVDLRGFGDSGNEPGEYDSTTSAEDLHLLIGQLDAGPVHLTGQDISGATVFRLAATHPQDVLSLTAIEMGLAGFGLEMLADVTHGGSWHIGVLAAPGIPEMLLAGREREFLGQFAFPAMSATPGAITDADIEEFARTYSRPGGWRGSAQAEAPSRPAPCPRPRRATSAQCHSTAWATIPPWKPPTSWRRPFSTSPHASTPPDCSKSCPDQPGSRCGSGTGPAPAAHRWTAARPPPRRTAPGPPRWVPVPRLAPTPAPPRPRPSSPGAAGLVICTIRRLRGSRRPGRLRAWSAGRAAGAARLC